MNNKLFYNILVILVLYTNIYPQQEESKVSNQDILKSLENVTIAIKEIDWHGFNRKVIAITDVDTIDRVYLGVRLDESGNAAGLYIVDIQKTEDGKSYKSVNSAKIGEIIYINRVGIIFNPSEDTGFLNKLCFISGSFVVSIE